MPRLRRWILLLAAFSLVAFAAVFLRTFLGAGIQRVLGAVGSVWAAFWSLKPETQISAIQLFALIVAGIWVLVLYQRRREGQATVRVGCAGRVAVLPSGKRKLLVRLHITNESAVAVEDVRSTLTLLEVASSDTANELKFKRIATQDALLHVNGEMEELAEGWIRFEPEPSALEPNECFESEVAFDLEEGLDLLAVRSEVEGEQRTFRPHWWGWPDLRRPGRPWGIRFRELFVWASFTLVEPGTLKQNYEMLGLHDRLAD